MVVPSSGRFLVVAGKVGSSIVVRSPSFRALPRFFCSSEGKSASSVVRSPESSASTYSKVEDEELPVQSRQTPFWCGPWWAMRGEYAVIRKEYPKIAVYKVDRCTIVNEEFKGPKTIRQTIHVIGGDVKKLEAAAERINKQQQ